MKNETRVIAKFGITNATDLEQVREGWKYTSFYANLIDPFYFSKEKTYFICKGFTYPLIPAIWWESTESDGDMHMTVTVKDKLSYGMYFLMATGTLYRDDPDLDE